MALESGAGSISESKRFVLATLTYSRFLCRMFLLLWFLSTSGELGREGGSVAAL